MPESKVSEFHSLDTYIGKKVLIAGGTGMIGRPLSKLLSELGAEVTVAGLEESNLGLGLVPEGVVYTQADFTDLNAARLACEGQDLVFNLVGIKGSVGIGESKAASYLVPMLRFQTNLTEAAWAAGVKGFLFVSSINVYPPSERHIEENAWNGPPLQNDRVPGVGKRVGEVLGLAFELEHQWKAFKTVRPANVYGPFDVVDPLRSQVIPGLIRKFLSGSPTVAVWGSGETIRDFVYSEDMAYWFARAILDLPTNVPVNLGSGTGVSIETLARTIASLTGFTGALEFDGTKPSGDPVRLLDITRAKKLMGYSNLTTLEAGLAKTIHWMRSVL
jgi:GDP-L-fucose synthase